MKIVTVYVMVTFLCSIQAKGSTFSPRTNSNQEHSEYSLILMNSLQTQAGFQDMTPEDKSDDYKPDSKDTKPNHSDQKEQDIAKKEEVIPEPPAPKVPSAGEKNIQEMLKKNREKLQQMHGNSGAPATGGGEAAVKAMLEKNKQNIKEKHANEKAQEEQERAAMDDAKLSGDLKRQYLLNLSKLKLQNKKTLSNWKSLTQETYSRWREKQKEFLANLKDYKQNTFDVKEFSPKNMESAYSQSGLKKKKLKPVDASKVQLSKFHVLPGAMDLPIRDQSKRPTCAAFAGIRATEILLMEHGINKDLSEQYFYWASKPECQFSPCDKRGSWVLTGYKTSSQSSMPDIPLEEDCPYSPDSKNGNETQIPLDNSCRQSGIVKVESFRPIAGLGDILDALNKGSPVVGGIKLSPNFYTNEGIVKYSERYLGGQTDSHAAGHAVLFIGYMQLPPEMNEGKLCLITANSWGEGWGIGGHACLTEKWFQEYHIPNAFMAMEKVSLK